MLNAKEKKIQILYSVNFVCAASFLLGTAEQTGFGPANAWHRFCQGTTFIWVGGLLAACAQYRFFFIL